MLLNEMSFLEVQEYIKTNNHLIIPVATCEQHGAHLPLNNDTLGAEYLAKVLSDRTGCLVAPTVPYGVNLPCNKNFSGTATISPQTLRAILSEITEWWRLQGFTYFFILTFHGDPFHIRALSEIAEDIILIEPYEIDYSDILEKQETMRHSCEAETSIALYLYPDKVRTNCINEHDIPFSEFRKYLFHEIETPPEGYIGCLGFPKSATAEKGKLIVERMIDKMMEEYQKALK